MGKTDVEFTDQFAEWYGTLDVSRQEDVRVYVGLLEEKGVTLDHPHSTAIKGSKYALRELRVQSGGHPIRVFYIFDPRRRAVLLIGGNKKGTGKRFYERFVSIAEKLFEVYLEETDQTNKRKR